jgi:hypothetical protein
MEVRMIVKKANEELRANKWDPLRYEYVKR